MAAGGDAGDAPSSANDSFYGEKKFFKTEVACKDGIDASEWRGWLPQLPRPTHRALVPQPPPQFGQFKWAQRGISTIARDANRRAPRDRGATPASEAGVVVVRSDGVVVAAAGALSTTAVLKEDVASAQGQVDEMGRISRELLNKGDVLFRNTQPVDAHYATITGTGRKAAEVERPVEPKLATKERPLPRAALLAHPASPQNGTSHASDSAAKVIRARIAEMRGDAAKLAEFSEQCEEWIAECKQRKMDQAAGDAGHVDFIATNSHPRQLDSFHPEEQAAVLYHKAALNETHRQGCKEEHRKQLTKEYYKKLKELRKNQLRRALAEGTLSRRQLVDVEASRRWAPVLLALRFCRRGDAVVQDRRVRLANAMRFRQHRAVRLIERWWCEARGKVAVESFLKDQSVGWQQRAQDELKKASYRRIAQFMKDWVTSRKVIEAVRKLLNRTRLVQRWFRSMIAIRRARYRLWLIQWQRYEQAARQPEAGQRGRGHQRRPPTQSGGAAGGGTLNLTAPHPPTRGSPSRSASLRPAGSPGARLRTPGRLVGKPGGTMLWQREKARYREMRNQAKNFSVRLEEWKGRMREHELTVKEYRRQREHMSTMKADMGVAELPPPTPPPPPPPRPHVVYVLPQADLAAMIEATTKRVQAEIAERVSQSLERADQECPELAPLPATGTITIVERGPKNHPTSFETLNPRDTSAAILSDLRARGTGSTAYIL
eukprot:TRINITY_DN7518_c0_g3_i1.p1 TRINITY_DN7518_c0_g3~~TRINITY_DN7518_c0_g3_i1.p1  ORF type:complete len:717 (+),score=255.86 TRINITY_DN7518_c0_g3_i1:116-2266(+)